LTPSSGTITAQEGASFSGLVGSFTDADPNGTAGEYAAQIQWGDGTTSTGTITKTASGTFNVTGSHTYADEGTDAAKALITDNASTNKATVASTANVAENDVLAPTPSTISATEGKAATGLTVATFTDNNPSAAASDFTASIDWGDQTTSAGTITLTGGVFSVTDNHTYADEGSYSIKITIKDDGAGTASANVTSTVDVAEADALTGTKAMITASEGQANNVTVATFSDTNLAPASDFTASIDWGDGTTTGGTVSGSNGVFSVNGSHTYNEEGSFTLKTTISDDGTGTSKATVANSVQVADGGLTVTAATVTPTVAVSFTGAVATFTDANPSGTPSDFTATINWGDGTPGSTGTITQSGSMFTVTGSHTFATTGQSTATVNLADVGGSTATGTDTVTSLTPNQKWVSQFYLDLLHRPADPSGLMNWSTLLDQGVSRTQIALDIEASQEYLTDVVEGVYNTYLHRTADSFGLNAFVNYLAGGGTVEGLQAIIAGSAEFFQDAGGTNDSFVQLLYRDALGRPADATGRSLADAALAAGFRPAQVAEAIFSSQEYLTDLLQSYYQQFLRRPADPSGINIFVSALQSGTTNQDVIAIILGSPEYFNDVTH
jgi:hypothetical protein